MVLPFGSRREDYQKSPPVPKYLNNLPWEHRCQYGTVFNCARCDFKAPMVATNWPRNPQGELDGEQFASDVAEMIGWWTVNIQQDGQLDPRQGFAGFDAIQWELK
jgi:hypothetical protein